MKKHLVLSIAAICFLAVPLLLHAGDRGYVASQYSIKYHKPTCKKALKIQPQAKIKFSTAKKALGSGRIPCNVCNPPTED